MANVDPARGGTVVRTGAAVTSAGGHLVEMERETDREKEREKRKR